LSALRVGILADTHGLLRPQALERLAGCDLLLHAGDVGEAEILSRLGALAPVVAVRGNTDCGDLARLPAVAAGTLEAAAGGAEAGTAYRMTHRREDVPPGWTREARLVVFGHSHRPELEWQGACLLLNPGSCGPSRFSLPLTVAVVTVDGRRLIPEILAIG
jgi:putative phosphoesterase